MGEFDHIFGLVILKQGRAIFTSPIVTYKEASRLLSELPHAVIVHKNTLVVYQRQMEE